VLSAVSLIGQKDIILSHTVPGTTKALDGSIAAMDRLLRELAEITAQDDSDHAAPVLELQFGDIATRTTLLNNAGMQCLSIIALLPRSGRVNYSTRTHTLLSDVITPAEDMELLWHADEGRYILLRHMPISDFADDISVLDAILDTADRSRAWYISALQLRSTAS
jgi:hypothetical protein